jgi:type I restriction enzyme S subunit
MAIENWQQLQLGEVVRLQRGHDLPESKRCKGNVPVIGSFGQTGWHNEAKAPGPGVTIGRSGASIGVISFVQQDYWPLNTALYVTDFLGNDPKFCFYFLTNLKLTNYNSGSAQPSLNRNYIYNIPVKIPRRTEQEAIAHILGTLDDKIELNRRMNQTLEAIAQAIFKSWFVDFEPVKAKQQAREAGKSSDEVERAAMAAISGKAIAELDQLPEDKRRELAQTAALFPDDFEDSELGAIPKGWEFRQAQDIANISIGKTPPRKEKQWFSLSPHDIRWVSIRDMGNSSVYIHQTSEFLTEEAANKFRVVRVPDNTVLLSFKLTIGRVAITVGEMLTNEAIAHLKLSEKSPISTEFLYCYLKNFDFNSLGSTSSIAQAINSKTVKLMPILIPNQSLSARFLDKVFPLFGEIKSHLLESSTLAQLRDTLLPKLLSGEITVAEAETQAEEALTQ